MLNQYYPQPPFQGFKYELNKDFEFSAAHFIPHKDAGKCQNVHGHTYVVNLTIGGDKLDELGFLVNFSGLKKHVHDRYDHTLLNNHSEFTYVAPSTERVAEVIHNLVEAYLGTQGGASRGLKCTQVILRETPSSYVIYRG